MAPEVLIRFNPPCIANYGCEPNRLKLYARDGPVDFVQCGSCNTIWKDTSKYADERVYEENYFSRRSYHEKRVQRVRKSDLLLGILEQFVSPGRLLEIGPAFGYNIEAAMQRGWKAEGIDISDHAVAACRELGLDVKKGSLSENDKPTGAYNAIIMRHVFEHYQDPFKALEEGKRLLCDNGYMLILVPNANLMQAKRVRGKHKFYRADKCGIEHFVYYTRETLEKLLEHSGFEVVQENFPVLVRNDNGISRIIERLFRRSLTLIDFDQELLVIARKKT